MQNLAENFVKAKNFLKRSLDNIGRRCGISLSMEMNGKIYEGHLNKGPKRVSLTGMHKKHKFRIQSFNINDDFFKFYFKLWWMLQ